MPQRRVVITGLGIVSPLGLDMPTSWHNLVSGKSGVARITRFDPTGFETQIAAEVRGFDPGQHLDPKEARRMDRFAQFAVVAAKEAVGHASLDLRSSSPFETGTIVSAGFGGAETLAEGFDIFYRRGPDRIRPLQFPMMISNMAAAQVAIELGIKGPNFSIASACASSAHAIGEAVEVIRRGDAKVMLAGGTEAGITPISVAALNAMRALSTRNEEPERASRPFEAERDGFVLGEGAAVVVLEDVENALRREGQILAEVVGYGATADAAHITAPDMDGTAAIYAMRRALEKSQLGIYEIDYINAHGTATKLNDQIETKVIREVFGPAAPNIPISSTKSMTGHLMSAAGALEAVICVLALRDGIAPPTINYEHRDPECNLYYVPNSARSISATTAMSNSMGFGGQNAVLIFRKWED